MNNKIIIMKEKAEQRKTRSLILKDKSEVLSEYLSTTEIIRNREQMRYDIISYSTLPLGTRTSIVCRRTFLCLINAHLEI